MIFISLHQHFIQVSQSVTYLRILKWASSVHVNLFSNLLAGLQLPTLDLPKYGCIIIIFISCIVHIWFVLFFVLYVFVKQSSSFGENKELN